MAVALVWNTAWSATPSPVVDGDDLSWPAVAATAINVHRGDGSYVESLPGSATSWTAPGPGEYYLVAADERDWRFWPRSEIVKVDHGTTGGAPMPFVQDTRLYWPPVSALAINVHRGDGSYVESLPGTATTWAASEYGDYYLVASNEGDWPSWPRSGTVTVEDYFAGAVSGLRADVYSRTAAEVFWDRKPGNDNRYLVFVDGEEVADTDGTSWFSDSFAAGTVSVVSVVAIGVDGSRSAGRSVAIAMPGDGPAVAFPTISRDNYENLLAEVFGAYFGAPYREPLLDLTDNLLGGVINAAHPFDAPYFCVNGGRAVFSGPYRMEFDDCRMGSATYAGDFYIADRTTGFGSAAGLEIVTDSGTMIRFKGSVGGFPSLSAGFFASTNVDVSVETGAGEVRLEETDHEHEFFHLMRCCGNIPYFVSSYGGSFGLRSPSTDGQRVSAETLKNFYYEHPRPRDPLSQPADWNHLTGIMSVSAADGSRLIVNADTGDDDTVTIQLINGTEVEEFTRSWADRWSVWQRLLP